MKSVQRALIATLIAIPFGNGATAQDARDANYGSVIIRDGAYQNLYQGHAGVVIQPTFGEQPSSTVGMIAQASGPNLLSSIVTYSYFAGDASYLGPWRTFHAQWSQPLLRSDVVMYANQAVGASYTFLDLYSYADTSAHESNKPFAGVVPDSFRCDGLAEWSVEQALALHGLILSEHLGFYLPNLPLLFSPINIPTLGTSTADTAFALWIDSDSPSSGVQIGVSQADSFGYLSGVTGSHGTLKRLYGPGTAVTLTAPATAPNGNAFQTWWGCTPENGGILNVGARTCTTSMNMTAWYTASYAPGPATFTITLSAAPSAGGTVTGGGTFAAGSSRTVTATASGGYTFANWTENSGVVSTSASYSFTLNSNRTLVAHFTSASASGTCANPIVISSFPYTDTNTTVGKGSSMNWYSCDTSKNEGGPEVVYRFYAGTAGTLTVTVPDPAGPPDIDPHLLSSCDPNACLRRNNTSFSLAISAGTYYIVCDTYVDASNSGAYTLNVDFTGSGDTTPPTVRITSPTSTSTYSTSSSTLDLGGTASDTVGVTQVTWVNGRGGSGTASGTTSWTADGIALYSGTNVLTVTARDAANNQGADVLTVTYNTTPPPCTSFAISSSSASPTASAGSISVTITGLPTGCQGGTWNASGNGSWLTASPSGGSGSGSTTIAWDQNPSSSPRSGTATIAGNAFMVYQGGAAGGGAPHPFLDVTGATAQVHDLSVGPDGTVYVLYPSSGHAALAVVRSADGGESWSSPVLVPDSAFSNSNYRFFSDSSGTIHVVWSLSSGGSDVYYSRSRNGAVSFEAPKRIRRGESYNGYRTHNGTEPVVAADGLGNVYVAYGAYTMDGSGTFMGYNVWVSKSTDNGDSFLPEFPINDISLAQKKPKRIIARASNFYVLYIDQTNEDLYFYRRNAGAAPGHTGRVNAGAGSVQYGGDFAVAPNDLTVYAAYSDTTGDSEGNITFCRSIDGGITWPACVRVNDSARRWQCLPAVGLDGLGGLHAAWTDLRSGHNDQTYYSYSADTGETFSANENVSAPLTENDFDQPHLVVDDANSALYISATRDISQVMLARRPLTPVGMPTRFFTATPCRLFDTRHATGADAASPILSSGETRLLTIGGRCSVPSSAESLSVNVTVTGQAAAGEFLLYRGDLALPPTASSLSFAPGKTRANNSILELARDGSGTFKVWNSSAAPAHFILDVNGYFQ